ncbi:unnamed protein product [Gongylonema pulchrum]|uniref:E3 ubiquitin-protein ligase n=1 Tax=Gongylonema pulchrum TaxID=637853 RepID=A0A183CWI2_9BILA|nr:unnamed protein product [Gongylonema pulchrum]
MHSAFWNYIISRRSMYSGLANSLNKTQTACYYFHLTQVASFILTHIIFQIAGLRWLTITVIIAIIIIITVLLVVIIQIKAIMMIILMAVNEMLVSGWPLHAVIADLIEQLGYTVRDFYMLDGGVRLHMVPSWAIHVFIVCAVLLLLAVFMEWYVVRRKLVKRSINGMQPNFGKSKTHIIFY